MSMQLNTGKKIIGGIAVLTIVILVGGIFLFSSQQSQESSVSEEQIVSRVGLHWHPKLDVYINGEKQEIPANLGLGAVHLDMHTHAEDSADGVVHMEMSGVVTKEKTRLGNFFRIWGKEFSADQLFDKMSGEEGTIKMFVNGQDNYDFENYLMRDGDRIEIRYE